MRLPRFILRQDFTEKQARHKALKPSKWCESYVCEACGQESVACGFIESKQWLIYAVKKCPACEARQAIASKDNVLAVAKERALKIAGGVR